MSYQHTARIARLLVTEQCDRTCDGCCNTYARVMKQMRTIDSLDSLADFDEVCITGGEPMLVPNRTRECITQLRELGVPTIYLYTALWTSEFREIAEMVDGVHFTLHWPLDWKTDQEFGLVQHNLWMIGSGSHRLYVDSRINTPVPVRPCIWSRVEMSAWLTEIDLFLRNGPTGLPPGEKMFIWKDK